MTVALLFIGLFVLLLLGVPISISLGLAALGYILFHADMSPVIVAQKLFDTMEHTTLLSIPFFILSSHFLTTGGVSERLIEFAKAMVASRFQLS